MDLTLGFRHLCDEVLRNWIVYLFPDVQYKTAISFHTTPKLILGANWPRRRRDLKPQQTNKPKFIPFQKRTSDSLARQTLESNTNRNRTTQWCPANCTECTKKSVWCDACSFIDLRPLVERFEAVAVWMEELRSSFKVWSAISMCDQPSSVALSDTTRYILPFLLDIGTGSLGYEKCLWKMSQLMQWINCNDLCT